MVAMRDKQRMLREKELLIFFIVIATGTPHRQKSIHY